MKLQDMIDAERNHFSLNSTTAEGLNGVDLWRRVGNGYL